MYFAYRIILVYAIVDFGCTCALCTKLIEITRSFKILLYVNVE